MQRFLILVYGVLSYVIFFATFVYAIGFVGNLWVPKSIDSVPQAPFAQALLINLGLLALIAAQQTLIARTAFRQWLSRYVPRAAVRSTCLLISSHTLMLLFHFWEPMGGVLWNVEGEASQIFLHSLFFFGWLLLIACTFLIDHFDLFGLRQVWRNMRRQPHKDLPFLTPFVSRLVRRPLYLGWLLAFWATPTMTAAHLLFAIATTAYVFIMIQFEERDMDQRFVAHPHAGTALAAMILFMPWLDRG